MGRGTELTPDMRGRICALRNSAKWSYNQIARELNIPKATVRVTVDREAKRGPGNTTMKRSGRPGLLDDTEKDRIFQHIKENPRATHKELLQLIDNKISVATLRRLLKAHHATQKKASAGSTKPATEVSHPTDSLDKAPDYPSI